MAAPRNPASDPATPFVARVARAWLAVAWVFALAGSPVHALDPSKRLHQYVNDNWSIERGLPQITVSAITQDADGFLWVGTQAGLARFDGTRFTPYELQEYPGLQGAMIQSLATDADGRVWIGTYKGLAVLEDGRISAVPLGPELDPMGTAVVDVLAVVASDAGVEVATSMGVLRVEEGVLAPVPTAPRQPSYALLHESHAMWVGGAGGVWRDQDGVWEWFALPGTSTGAAVTRLLRDTSDRLWVGTGRGLFVFEDGRLQAYADGESAFRQPVGDMLEDEDGNLWVSTTDRLMRLRDGHLVESAGPGHPQIPANMRALFEDREGNLWLGSQSGGLFRLWDGWTYRYSLPEGLHDPVLWSVAPAGDGSILLGSSDGLSILRGLEITKLLPGASLPHPHVYTLLAEGETIWIGTRSGAVRLTAGELDTPEAFDALAGLQINGFLRTAAGTLWIATTGGLFEFDGHALVRHGQAEGIGDPRVRIILDEGRDGLLLGTQSGLVRFKDGRGEEIGVEQGLPPQLDITAVHRLDDGGLLLGTLSERLFHFDATRWMEISREAALPANAPFYITPDSHGWIWVAGIRGIYRFALTDLVRFRQDPEVGLPSEMLINERGIYRGGQKGYCCNGAGLAKGFIENDRLWLPSRDGLVSIAATDVHHNHVAPRAVIEQIVHGGEAISLRDGIDLGELPGRSRDLSMEFTTTSMQQPDSVEIRYRMLGYDDDWRTLVDMSRRSATYTNLPPGEYVFEVRAANNSGLWSEETASVAFSIRPRFHETLWFYGLIVLVGAGLGWGVARVRNRMLHRRQRQLERQIEERTADLEAANERLATASLTDALTGLHNRRYLSAQLPRDLAFYAREFEAQGSPAQSMVLAIIDIDHFKSINDRHGHLAGDEVLCEFAARLLAQVRNGDYVVRWGGEEFLLVMRPMPHGQAPRIIERLRAAVADQPFRIASGAELEVTCSIGFTRFPLFAGQAGPVSWEAMVELADRALYRVKNDGRDGWAVFEPASDVHPAQLQRMLADDPGQLATDGSLVLVTREEVRGTRT